MAKRMRTECSNYIDLFCYMCGRFTSKKNLKNIYFKTTVNYEAYFDLALMDSDKKWAPTKICTQCKVRLSEWRNKKIAKLKFFKPIEWFENSNILDHHSDCFFCRNYVYGNIFQIFSIVKYV